MNNKLLISSASFPPNVGGTPIILSNLFQDYEGEMTAVACLTLNGKEDQNFKPPCEVSYMKLFKNRVAFILYEKLEDKSIPLLKWFIKKNIQKRQPKVVFNVYPSASFFVATYLACKDLDIPYFIHMHDLWQENFASNHPIRKLANRWEKEIFSNAAKIMCMTDVQKDFYKEKYGVDAVLLPHTLPGKVLTNLSKDKNEVKTRTKKILYTGNISPGMNHDALKEFIKSVDLMPENYEVTMLCSYSEEQLKARELYNHKVKYGWVSKEEALRMASEADVLFLPLSHKNGAMKEVKTVYATKTLDYLVSGTPILVYAPRDSFHSKSATKSGWGYVVNEDEPRAIMEGIESLIQDAELTAQIVSSAKKEARRRDSRVYAEKLLSWVEEVAQ